MQVWERAYADNPADALFAVGLQGVGVAVAVNTGQAPFLYAGASSCLRLTGGGDVMLVAPSRRGAAPGVGGSGGAAEVARMRAELAALRARVAEAERGALDARRLRTAPEAELERLAGRVAAAAAAVARARGARVATAVADIVGNARLRAAARAAGVEIMRVAWEDTARTKGSCFGPNISDMTLAAGGRDMPIVRKPNFGDVTSDHDPDDFFLVVGNEVPGGEKETVTLRTYLEGINAYTGNPAIGPLLAPRDAKVLAASQACILPLRDGRVEFNVKLYNYQSTATPAVLVIVASAEGTSAQVVLGRENVLRFNKAGAAADFVAERLKDDRVKRGVPVDGPMTAEERARNCLLIIQVPLVYRPPARVLPFGGGGGFGGGPGGGYFGGGGGGGGYAAGGGGGGGSWGVPAAAAPVLYACSAPAAPVSFSSSSSMRAKVAGGAAAARPSAAPPPRGMDAAMLSTSEARGVFTGTAGFALQRDASMPIRVTLQWYHVTDSADIPDASMATIAHQVTELYDAAAPWNRGSLVTGGATGRVTEHTARSALPPPVVVWPPPWYFGFPVTRPRVWPPRPRPYEVVAD